MHEAVPPRPGGESGGKPLAHGTGRPMRIGVIGAGILGLAVARRLLELCPDAQVDVLEKESSVAAHQTGNNSGVVHAGIYYPPGSQKAEMCVRGVRLLRQYCNEKSLPYEECGKLIVAADDSEVAALRGIYERGLANGVPGLRMLNRSEMLEVEPHVGGVAAVHSPRTAIVDYGLVARSFAADVVASGARIRLDTYVTSLVDREDEVHVGSADETYTFDMVIACAGLYADHIARLTADGPDPMIVPFRGEYLQLRPDRTHLVRGLIYPVPDPRYPFLGVHLTRHVDGSVTVGPNAVLAFSREGYRFGSIKPRELLETLQWPGFRALAAEHWRTGVTEFAGSVSRRRFVALARRYVPELRYQDVMRGKAGVRAQAVDKQGNIVDDFRITRSGRVVHVRNAPSPAATASLPIAEHIVDRALSTVG